MRVLFVADLHYALKQFDWLTIHGSTYDAIVIGGDLLDLASALDLDVQIVVMEKYFERLCRQTQLIVCSGNHDGDSRNAANESIARWLRDAKAPRLAVDGDSVELADTLVTICPWWDGPISQAEVEAQLARDAARRASKWIWIHHSPPDQASVSWTGRKFAGDKVLTDWILRFQPDLVLSGHIHNAPFYAKGSWIDRLGKTWTFNPGRQIGPIPTFVALDLDQMTAAWCSAEGEGFQELAVEAAPPANVSSIANSPTDDASPADASGSRPAPQPMPPPTSPAPDAGGA